MRKLKIYIATSLDGYIADHNGNIEWLTGFPNPEQTDYGYADFLAGIDTTLMGYKTYQDVLKLSETFPYPGLANYIFSRDKSHQDTEFVTFVKEEAGAFVSRLKSLPGKDIWLIGGGELNAAILEHDLVDEMIIHTMPVVLGAGRSVFAGIPMEKTFGLESVKTYSSGVVEARYTRS
ncbi:dihydrofolate reductase [Chitinophaga sp. Mgbs1]|uniref:Dihydrofolate reductase n=1 Tax=Chitinophaga solisilvae TaxID=1233460 RepID=A0A3S1B3G4_9BACT|nr:dihydrofolate reductase [Chitinophaga solisilvae]